MVLSSSHHSALLLLLLCLTAVCFAEELSKSGFLLRLPRQLHAGSVKDRACFTQLPSAQPATQVWLRLYETKIPHVDFGPPPDHETFLLYSTHASVFFDGTSDVDKCFDINLPQSITAPEAALRVVVFAGDGSQLYPNNDAFNRTDPDVQVSIRAYEILTDVKTDKRRYRPGDTVYFRLLQTGEQRPVDGEVPEIWVTNPAGIRMTQWRRQHITKGLMQKHFRLASDSSKGMWTIHLKTWGKIHTKTFSVEEYTPFIFDFEVHAAKQVPRDQNTYTVKVCPLYLSGVPMLNTEIYVKVSSEHDEITASRPLEKSRVCRVFDALLPHAAYYESQLTVDVKVHDLDSNQTRSKVMVLRRKGRQDSYYRITLETRGPYVQPLLPIFGRAFVENEYGNPAANITLQICLKANFNRLSGYTSYRSFLSPSLAAELPNEVKTQLDQVPFLWERLYDGRKHDESNSCREFLTDQSGHVSFKFPPQAANLTSIALTASTLDDASDSINSRRLIRLTPSTPSRQVNAVRSFSNHYLLIDDSQVPTILQCDREYTLRVVTSLEESEAHPTMYYDVVGQGRVIFSGTVEGETVRFQAVARASPQLAVIVFMVLPSGEVVSDSKMFRMHQCLPMNVSMTWDTQQVTPGGQTTLTIHGEPHAFCSIAVKDNSTLLEQPEEDVPIDVFINTPTLKVQAYCRSVQAKIYEALRRYGSEDPTLASTLQRMSHGFSNLTDTDSNFFTTPYMNTLDSFHAAGYKVVSDLGVRNSLCLKQERRTRSFSGWDYRNRRSASASRFLDQTHGFGHRAIDNRDHFPETHFFDIKQLDENGLLVLPQTLPGSTTTWQASALCTGEAGLGKATDYITVSKPFHISMVLPYALKRGEILQTKVTVQNQYDSTLSASVQLQLPSSHYHLANSQAPTVVHLCIASSSSEVVTFPLAFNDLGEVNVTVKAYAEDGYCDRSNAVHPHGDVVTRSLLIKPTGFPHVETTSHFMCPHDDESLSVVIALPKPRGLVSGSEQTSLQVYGDLLAPTTQNVVKLIQLPVGGAEPNLVSFVSNIFVRSYLESVGLLTNDSRQVTQNNMRSGYMRELQYRRSDGAYSSFGEEDSEPSFWLTAFVIKSFKEASHYIDIDEVANLDSANWLLQQRDDHGCFHSSGRVLHQEMKGGVDRDGDVSLTAYVILALSGVVTPDKLNPSFNCINHALRHRELSLYTESLIAHTFLSVGLKNLATPFVNDIITKATYEGDKLAYWRSDRHGPHGGRRAVDVEMTSYVVMSLLRLKTPEYFRLAKKAVTWLESKRTEGAGFESIQEIAAALEALAQFGRSTFTSSAVSHVIATPLGATPIYITINLDNRLLFNQYDMSHVPLPSVVDFQVSGGCVTVQTTLRYTSTLKVPRPFFSLVVTSSEHGRPGLGTNYALKVCVTPVTERYVRPLQRVQLSMEMPSGFIPVPSTLRKLRDSREITRYDINGNDVAFILANVGSTSKCIQFRVIQESVVEQVKDAVATVHDFYEPQHREITHYHL